MVYLETRVLCIAYEDQETIVDHKGSALNVRHESPYSRTVQQSTTTVAVSSETSVDHVPKFFRTSF